MIREAKPSDADAIWDIIHEVVSKGDTYAIDPEIPREDALDFWLNQTLASYVVELDEEILGTYFMKKNHQGPADHVCNCGYMTTARARGRGLATQMCIHSQEEARRLGFKAMQFNSVVATNEGAFKLWQKLGFQLIGTVPKMFRHPELGYVDSHIMYKWLED